MQRKNSLPRRTTLKRMGAAGMLAFTGAAAANAQERTTDRPRRSGSSDIRKQIAEKVRRTPFIDTHEHLIEEKGRLAGTSNPWVTCDDWAFVLSHYYASDLLCAGMPEKDYTRFFSPGMDPVGKWKLIEPWWPATKNTGYGQAVSIALRELYGVDNLSAKTVREVQAGYERVRRAGFYERILRGIANIESCQVNCLEGVPFMESAQPTLLMQDLSIVGMFDGPDVETFGRPTGKTAASLSDWHAVIDWWFAKYSAFAVAVKSQNAYSRNIDYEDVPAEKVSEIFTQRMNGKSLAPAEKKALEDHLFWYAVRKATECSLPVKLHTGYYFGHSSMPLGRLINNPGAATELCRLAPETRFVFMHICYPYYEEMISIAKQWPNAYMDMCWSWIINPVAAKDFLKKYLVTAPANKVLTFGGDYIPVEPVLGHAAVARNGISLALAELVEEGWMSLADALEIIDPIMHGNARGIFNLAEKKRRLETVKWG